MRILPYIQQMLDKGIIYKALHTYGYYKYKPEAVDKLSDLPNFRYQRNWSHCCTTKDVNNMDCGVDSGRVAKVRI